MINYTDKIIFDKNGTIHYCLTEFYHKAREVEACTSKNTIVFENIINGWKKSAFFERTAML